MPDASRPTAADPLVALADRCVQCGLCLPVCPTYAHDAVEAESPRGRIALARAWALETIEPGLVGDAHLDHCLACRSCEAVCPAGVEYGALLLATRGRQRARRGAHWLQCALEAVVERPRLLAMLLGMYRRGHRLLPERLRPPRPPPPALRATPATPLVAAGVTGAPRRIALFQGCVAGPYEPEARAALARLCAALSIGLEIPSAQGCCGALHAHAGNLAGAARLAAINRTAFADYEQVLTLASGCHESVAAARDGAGMTTDALAFLDARRERLVFAERHERVALHLPCTQRNVVGSVDAMRRLLARIPGLVVIELDAGFGCCGAAGSQMLTDPERAASYRQPLLVQLAASGATRLLSANIGCRLHLAGDATVPVQHPLEFLADALATPGQSQACAPQAVESAP